MYLLQTNKKKKSTIFLLHFFLFQWKIFRFYILLALAFKCCCTCDPSQLIDLFNSFNLNGY